MIVMSELLRTYCVVLAFALSLGFDCGSIISRFFFFNIFFLGSHSLESFARLLVIHFPSCLRTVFYFLTTNGMETFSCVDSIIIIGGFGHDLIPWMNESVV